MIFMYFALGYFFVGVLYWMCGLYYVTKKEPEGYEAFIYRLKNRPTRIKVLTIISLALRWPIYVYENVKRHVQSRIAARRIKRIDKELARRKGLV